MSEPRTNEEKTDLADDAGRNMQSSTRLGGRVQKLRIRHGMSTDNLITGMNRLGYNWNRTTLFNVEHNMRRLQFQEAVDILKCVGLDPYKDLYLLLEEPEEPAVDVHERKMREYEHNLIQAWNAYIGYSQVFRKMVDVEEEQRTITAERAESARNAMDEFFARLADALQRKTRIRAS